MGKGSNRRPEDTAKIDANWDRIFGKGDDRECTNERGDNTSQHDIEAAPESGDQIAD